MSGYGGRRDSDNSKAVWYALRSRQPIGPLSVNDVRDLIDRRMLTDFDSLRRNNSEEWRLVRDLKEQFFSHQVDQTCQSSESNKETLIASDDESVSSTSLAAESLLKKMQSNGSGPVVCKRKFSQRLRGFLQFVVSLPIAVILILTAVRESRLRIPGWKYGLAVIGCLLVLGIGLSLQQQLFTVDAVAAHQHLQELHEELATKNLDADSKNVSLNALRWEERFNRSASPERPELLELNSAAKLFPLAIQELQAEANSSQTLRKIEIHLANAQNQIRRAAERSRSNSFLSKIVNSPSTFSLMLCVDAILVGCFLVYVVRRPKRAAV